MNGKRRRHDTVPTGLGNGLAAVPSRWPFLLLLAMAVLILPWVRAARSDDPDDERIPWAYSNIVNDASAQSWLLPRPPLSAGDLGEVRIGPLAPPEFAAFTRSSFLRTDMQSLDAAVWRWRFGDRARIEIEPRAHLIGGPFDRDPIWRGDLLFANAEELTLREGDRSVAGLSPATLDGNADCAPLWLQQGAARAAPVHERICLKLDVDGVPRTIAVIRRVGNQALFLATSTQGVRMELGGRDASRTEVYAQTWHWLEPNQTLRFSWPGGNRLFWLDQRRPPISAYRANGQRIRDASLESLARPIEAAMGDTSASLTTTLRSDLQSAAQAALVRIASPLRADIGSFRAAAVLMDGLTGEVAALPTFPAQIQDLDPRQRNSIREQRLTQQNGNFIRMVVGSAAKPPLAFAILDQIPSLRGLQITPVSPFRQILGIDLGTDVEDHRMPPRIDFNTFLSHSSNQYASTLMLFGLSDPAGFSPFQCGDRTEIYWLGGIPHQCVPPRPVIRTEIGARPGAPVSLGATPVWGYALDRLFCIAHQDRLSTQADNNPGVCLRSQGLVPPIWREPDSPPSFSRPIFLAPVAPDPEAFGFNVVDDIYSDYVMTILGGSRGRWTTISLAQTYARMLTARAVTARLLPLRTPEHIPVLPAGPNLQIAREAVLEGLVNVVSGPGGTGNGIARAIFSAPAPNGDLFRLFAKTGTPAIERNTVERARLQAFADAGCGLRLTTRAGLRSLTVGRGGGDPVAAIRALGGACGRFAQDAQSLADEINLLNRGHSLAGVEVGPDGVVGRVPPRQSDGAGHVLVLMIERFQPATHQICSLRVVAANLQARVVGQRTPAIAYVNQLFDDPTARGWLQGQPCAARGGS